MSHDALSFPLFHNAIMVVTINTNRLLTLTSTIKRVKIIPHELLKTTKVGCNSWRKYRHVLTSSQNYTLTSFSKTDSLTLPSWSGSHGSVSN